MKLTKSKLKQIIKEALEPMNDDDLEQFQTMSATPEEVTWDGGVGSIRLHGDKVFVDDGGGPSVIPLATLEEFVERFLSSD